MTAYADFEADVTPPSLEADLEVGGQIVGNVTASIELGIEPPSVDLQISIMADLLAEAQAAAAILLNLFNLFAVAGVHAYAYDGDVDALGGEFSTELAGGFPGGSGSDHCNAVVLATTSGTPERLVSAKVLCALTGRPVADQLRGA